MSGKHGRRAARPSRGRDVAAEPSPPEVTEPSLEPIERAGGSRRRHASSSASKFVSLVGREIGSGETSGRTATIDRPHEPLEPEDLDDSPTLMAGPRPLDLIIPGAGMGSRRAARQEKQEQQRKRALMIGAGVLVLALIVWAIVGSGKSGKHQPVAATGARTQSTLLVQVKGSLGAAVDSALLAHDTAAKSGVVVLVPSAVISQVPGFGPMPFGQALTLGQPDASRATLSDLVGVTIDGSWVLTEKGLQTLVDKVGGVTVTVDKDVTRPGPNGTTTIVVPAGQQKLTGANAVAFATYLASGETEQLRLARFDAVFTALLQQLPKQPAAVASLITGLGSGSTSSMATTRVADLLTGLAADNAASSTLDTVLPVTRLDTGDDQNAFSLDTAKNSVLVKQQFTQSIPANAKTTGNRVMIENQVGTPGIGETTRAKLLHAGFTYLPGQNAPGMPNATAASVVLISGTTAADIAKGNAVAKALGLPTSDVRVSQESVRVADVIVLLGADYKP
jgi:hypothetical protein